MTQQPEPSPSPQARRSARPVRMIWVVFGVGATGIVLGIILVMLLLPKWLGNTDTGAKGPPAASADRRIHATLFYVADDGSELVPVSREVPLGSTPGEQARRIVEAQLQPAPAGLISPVPSGTSVHSVYLTTKGEAFVDFSKEIVAGHPGGSLNETLTVFAVVNALTVNLPDVGSVQMLIDGKEVDTLAGHIDLKHPLKRSMKWIRRGQ
jgi:hypothetical protein